MTKILTMESHRAAEVLRSVADRIEEQVMGIVLPYSQLVILRYPDGTASVMAIEFSDPQPALEPRLPMESLPASQPDPS